MKQFKYTLDKSSKKFLCPRCNKKSFVKFIETETGHFLSDEFGRCDHESSCQYFLKPDGELKNTFEIIEVEPPVQIFIDKNIMEQSEENYSQNNFVLFLLEYFSTKEVGKALEVYHIGTSNHYWKGATIFFQIDENFNIRTGKIILYDAEGKRVKEPRNCINWEHNRIGIKNENVYKCLFGLHLISKAKDKVLMLVESEKTAVLMSIFKPQYLWLATGSKSGFKYEFLKPIKDYKIIAFPDKSEYNDWLQKATKLNGFGFNISVNNWLENTDYPDGTDLADVYLNERNQQKNTFITT